MDWSAVFVAWQQLSIHQQHRCTLSVGNMNINAQPAFQQGAEMLLLRDMPICFFKSIGIIPPLLLHLCLLSLALFTDRLRFVSEKKANH